ncbi:MAG: TolC family protein, partial [bacterium]|nr:TolC family protein [bacterium]
TRADALADAVSSRLIREHQLFMARQTAVSGVIDAYFSAVLATEEIKVQERALAIAQEAADGARKRAEAGLVAEIEVSRAEIRVARTKDELNRKVQGARTATDKLMLAIGEGLGRSPELTTAVPEIAESFPDVDQAVIMAREGSVQLKIYDQRLQDNRRDLDISMDKLKPSLDAVVSYNSGNGSSAGSIFDDTSLVAGLQFSVPLDKRILREEKDGTARDLNLLKELRSFEADQVAGNVRAAYRARETADNTLRILGQNLETARENLRLAQRMVEEGLSSNRDVLEAQEALMTVESGLLAARLNFYLAGINLRKAMGEDLLKLKTVLQ